MAPQLLRPLSEYPTPQHRLLQVVSMMDSLDRLEVPDDDRATFETEVVAGLREAEALFVLRCRAAA